MHIAALHQGGLAWPCPAWLLPAAPRAGSQHGTGSQTHPDQTDAAAGTSGSSAATSSGSSAATSSESDAEQLSGSSSSSSSSKCSSSSSDDDASVNSATIRHASMSPTVVADCALADLLPAAAAAAVAHADTCTKNSRSSFAQVTSDNVSRSRGSQVSSSEGGADDSSCGESDCDSHDSVESDSSSDIVDAQDDSGHHTDTQKAVQSNGSQQQTAFDQLDVLFSRKGAAGSMSTHLAALDLLKEKPGQSMHSAAQSVGGKSQTGLLCKAPARLQAGKGGAKAGRGFTQQCVLAGEDGGKSIAKTEWVQMQNGGNPLYSNQKAGSASAGQCWLTSSLQAALRTCLATSIMLAFPARSGCA